MPTGHRIDVLKDLTGEQDLEIVKEFMQISPYMKLLPPEHRSDWYETHFEHAKRFGTNISEQMVISQQMADSLDGTSHATTMLAELTKSANRLMGNGDQT